MKRRCPKVNSAFWLFSQSIYAAAGVQEECLQLQDKFGIDINLLLFSAFVGAVHGALLSTQEVRDASAAVAQWQEAVVRPLRANRRTLKQVAPPHAFVTPLIERLRAEIKAVELEAERIEQIALEAWCQSRVNSWPRAERNAAVTANIRALFALSGAHSQIVLPASTIAAAQGAAREANH